MALRRCLVPGVRGVYFRIRGPACWVSGGGVKGFCSKLGKGDGVLSAAVA